MNLTTNSLRRRIHTPVVLLLLTIAPLAVRAQGGPTRDSAAAKIAASLTERNLEQALAAYDEYVSAVKKPDMELLRPIARAELERGGQSADRQGATDALERLARGGDAGSLTSLTRVASPDTAASREALAPLISLARLGDKSAQARLAAQLAGATPEAKVQAIQALQTANATTQAPAVAALLDDQAPAIRSAAAVAVGALQYHAAIPKLKALYASDVPSVKMLAGLALTRLGDPTAESAVTDLVKSQVPQIRLMAGEALQSSKSAQWMPLVKELRNDPNPVNRVRAAEVVACCDPLWAKGILVEALGDAMALVRLDAARVLEATGLADARIARQMLGDSSQAVRTYGAGAVLSAVAKPSARPVR